MLVVDSLAGDQLTFDPALGDEDLAFLVTSLVDNQVVGDGSRVGPEVPGDSELVRLSTGWAVLSDEET